MSLDDIADAKETLKEAIDRAANDRKGRGYTIGPKTPLAVWLTWKEWKSILAAAGGDERRVPVDAGEGEEARLVKDGCEECEMKTETENVKPRP